MKKYIFIFCILGVVFGTYSFVDSASKSLRIVAIGDSITYGTGDPGKLGYVSRLQTDLEETLNVSIKVINFAVPKYTTEDILKQLKDEDMRKKIRKADRLILFVGTNDFRKSASYQFEPLNVRGITNGKGIYQDNLKQILEILRKENNSAPIMVLGLFQPYVEFENNHAIQEVIEDWNRGIESVIQKFEYAYFVPTIDLFIGKQKEAYFSDSIHPNPNGYKLIAERIVNELNRLEDTYTE